jgi:tryptophan halogenase
VLKFKAGKRKQVWNRNVVAVGLSSGFLEPLESTSIHLIQSTVARLVTFFPDAGFHQADIDEFNRQADFEVERIRDFLILHYHATRRTDTPFWEHCRTMAVPATLRRKMDLWQGRGRLVRDDNELFTEVGWLQVLHGQGIAAAGYHPLVDLLREDEVAAYLAQIAGVVAKCVAVMPTHQAFIAAVAATGARK